MVIHSFPEIDRHVLSTVAEWFWTVSYQRGQFTCPKGHLSKTYRHRARVRVRFSVKFRNLHNFISDKWPFGQVTCNHYRLLQVTKERLLNRVVVKTFFRSQDQDRDLGLQVSRPRSWPWTSGLETETETCTKWTWVHSSLETMVSRS